MNVFINLKIKLSFKVIYLKMKSGHIYLIKLCDTSGRCIYKVGKSEKFNCRLQNYNYYEILQLIKSFDISEDESNIINIFKTEFELDKGREFFRSDDENKIMFSFTNYFYNKQKHISKNNIKKEVQQEVKLENKEIIIENEENKKIVVNDLKCPKCKQEYKYPSLLKRHLNNSSRCKDETIIVEPIEKVKDIINMTCNYCNKIFSRKNNLTRHLKETKCSNIKIINDKIIKDGINSISIDELKKIRKDLT